MKLFKFPALALSTAFTLISLTSPSNGEESTIDVGVISPLSGEAAKWGEYSKMGLEIAKEEVNSEGGINGKNLKLIYEDSSVIPSQSLTAYKKLTTADNVKYIIGNLWAFITNPLIPVSEQDKVLLISPTTNAESIVGQGEYFYSMGEHIDSASHAVSQFFDLNPEVKKIGILCWETSWGDAYLKMWNRVAESKGAEVIKTSCTSDFAYEYTTDIVKLKALNVDAVFIADNGDTILKRMKEQNLKAKVLSTSNIVEDIKIKNTPKDLFEGIFITEWKPSEEFSKIFKRKYDLEPILGAHNSYESLRSLARAMESEEPDVLLAIKHVSYQGVAGNIDFAKGHFPNSSVAKLYKVENGNLVLAPEAK